MKVFLMYNDRDFDMGCKAPWNEPALIQDLDLNTLFKAMARDDGFVFEVVKRATLQSLTDPTIIAYRQQVLRDCLRHSAVIGEMYTIAGEAIEKEKKQFFWCV